MPTGRTTRPRPRQARPTRPAVSPIRRTRSTVWYEFTPVSNERYAADTIGSDYDTTLYVGTPNGSGGIDVIACNDDAFDLQSAVAWDVEGGTTYLLMVGTCCGGGAVGEAGGGGSLVFHLDLAPPPPTIDLTVDARGSFNKAGSGDHPRHRSRAPNDQRDLTARTRPGDDPGPGQPTRSGGRFITGFGSGFEGPCTARADRLVGRGPRRDREVRRRIGRRSTRSRMPAVRSSAPRCR